MLTSRLTAAMSEPLKQMQSKFDKLKNQPKIKIDVLNSNGDSEMWISNFKLQLSYFELEPFILNKFSDEDQESEKFRELDKFVRTSI